MATWRNINGTWKSGTWWRNIAGTWKQCNVWRNLNGVWQNLSVIFTPDGGSVMDSQQYDASVFISCNVPALWTYSGSGGSVSRASGTTGTSISFSVSASGGSPGNRQYRSASYTLTGTANGVTRNFDIFIEAYGDTPL